MQILTSNREMNSRIALFQRKKKTSRTFFRAFFFGMALSALLNSAFAEQAIVLAITDGQNGPAPVFSVVDGKVFPAAQVTENQLGNVYANIRKGLMSERDVLLKGPRIFEGFNNPVKGFCSAGAQYTFNGVQWENTVGRRKFKLSQPIVLVVDFSHEQSKTLCSDVTITDVQGMKYKAHISTDFRTRAAGEREGDAVLLVETYTSGLNVQEDTYLQKKVFPEVMKSWSGEYDARAMKLWEVLRLPALQKEDKSLPQVKALLEQLLILKPGIDATNDENPATAKLKMEKVFSDTSRKNFLGYVISAEFDERRWIDISKTNAYFLRPVFQAFIRPFSDGSLAVLPRFNWEWSINSNEDGMWATHFNYVVIDGREFLLTKEYIYNEASYWMVDELVGRTFVRRANSGLISERVRKVVRDVVQ